MASVKRVRLELKPRWALQAIAAGYSSPHVAETTRKVLNRSRVLVNVRTGNLRGSLGMKMMVRRTAVIGEVSTKVKYAIYVHDGTKAHIIRARRVGGYLRFTVPPGVVIYRRQVLHPGYKGNPFLRRALLEEAAPRGYKVTGYSARSGKIGFGLAF